MCTASSAGRKGRRGAGGVGRIAPAQVGQHLVVVDGTDAAIDVLAHPAMGALLVGGGEEHLHAASGNTTVPMSRPSTT